MSGGTTGTAKCNCLTPKAFEALQLLKSAYCNGHLATDKEAQKHSLSLIDFSKTDDDELAGPKWKGKGHALDQMDMLIAICAKVWNHVNLSIFASSEAETCSTSITMTRCSIFIILVVSESPH